jgi:hypothetical protein
VHHAVHHAGSARRATWLLHRAPGGAVQGHNLYSWYLIPCALRPGVTATSERRGNGLPDLLSTASGFGGQLLLRSDDGYALVMAASSDRKFAAVGQVPGTWAWVHVRLPRQQRCMVSLQQ